MNFKFWVFNLIFFINYLECTKILKIPFWSLEIRNFYENNIYVNLNIGKPIQTIPLFISISFNPIYISNNKFNYKLSSTYKNKSNIKYIFKDNIDKAIESSDTFIFENNESSTIDFYLINNSISYLGLGRKIYDAISGGKWDDWNNEYNEITDFITGLKKNNIINKSTFCIQYNNNNYGEIIFGLEYENNKDLIIYKDFYRNIMDSTWDFKFDSIFIGNIIIKEYLSSTLDIQIESFIANKNIKVIFFNNFFKKYIEKKLCFEGKIETNIIDKFSYSFFYCNNDNNVNIKELDILNFHFNNINYNFTFNYLDLFKIHKTKLYFQILFREEDNSMPWIFGSLFFKKYDIIFNLEKEEIIWFKKINNNPKLSFFNMIIISIILFIIIIFQYSKRKKLKEEEYEMSLI